MCQKDALIVSFDKNYKDTKLLCGKKRPRGVTSTGNELWLKFRVDDSGTGKGFLANYRAVGKKLELFKVCNISDGVVSDMEAFAEDD